MTTIDPSRRREAALPDVDAASAHASAPRTSTAHAGAPEIACGLPESLLADFVRNVAPAEGTAPRIVEARLDAFRASTGGPYRVGDTWVAAAPQFRMNGGFTDRIGFGQNAGEVRAVCAALVRNHELTGSGVTHALMGRGTPSDLCRVTQALIDAGKLVTVDEMREMHRAGHLDGPIENPSLSDRIRATQWKYGIGFDCAGYSQQALLAAHGLGFGAADRAKLGLAHDPSNENFGGAWANRRLERIAAPESVRAGDVVSLDGHPPDVGHVVIVYAHDHGDAAVDRAVARFAALDPAAARAASRFAEGRDVDVFELDSSWGADIGASYGGVRRDTWLYDRTSKTWGWINPHGGRDAFEVGSVPCDERAIAGIYRAKGAGR